MSFDQSISIEMPASEQQFVPLAHLQHVEPLLLDIKVNRKGPNLPIIKKCSAEETRMVLSTTGRMIVCDFLIP